VLHALIFDFLNHRVRTWQDGHGQPGGRAEAAPPAREASKLLDEAANVLTPICAGPCWAAATACSDA
jgi:hypothetical protein